MRREREIEKERDEANEMMALVCVAVGVYVCLGAREKKRGEFREERRREVSFESYRETKRRKKEKKETEGSWVDVRDRENRELRCCQVAVWGLKRKTDERSRLK